MKFLDKLCNLVVILNFPKIEYGVWIIFKDASDMPKVIRLEGFGTLKFISIHHDLKQKQVQVVNLWQYRGDYILRE